MASRRKLPWDFPFPPRKIKTTVKFHYYTYPRRNDHECFTHFAFVDLLFFQEGKCDWFSYGQLVFLCRFSVGEGGFVRGNHTQIKISYPPLWSGLFDQEYLLKKFDLCVCVCVFCI